MNIHKHTKRSFLSPRKRLYIASSRRGFRAQRSVPRPLVAVLAVVAVAGLAVPVTMARQQSSVDDSGAQSETYRPQRTSGADTERAEPAQPPTPPVPAPNVAAEAQAAAARAEAAKQAQLAATAAVGVPAKILDLRNWKIALPVDTPHAGTPDEIKQPELAGFVLSPYFYAGKGGVVFQAHAGGATTKNSRYPRSELREMAPGGGNAATAAAAATFSESTPPAIGMRTL